MSLVLSSRTAQVPALVWERKIPHSEGKPGKIGRVGVQERRPHTSLQVIRGPEMLLGPWEGWDHNTPAQRLGEHSFTKLGLEICRAVPTTFQRNKRTLFFNKESKNCLDDCWGRWEHKVDLMPKLR